MAQPPYPLERFRPHLTRLARRLLGPAHDRKIDVADVVQQTMEEGWRAQAQQLALVEHILRNNVIDAIRKNPGHEVPIAEDGGGASAPAGAALVASGDSPSEQAARNERWRQVVEPLPEDQRTAVELHYLAGFTLDEIAAQMNRSKGAVAKLIERGTKRIRKQLRDREGGWR